MSSLISGFTGQLVVRLVLNIFVVLLAPDSLSNVSDFKWLDYHDSKIFK